MPLNRCPAVKQRGKGMNRRVIGAIIVVVVIIAVATLVFTSVNQTPSGGDGNTNQENIEAGVSDGPSNPGGQ